MTRILIKHNSTAGTQPTPSELATAELAINTADGKLYTKLESGAVVQVSGGSSSGGSADPDGGTYSDNIVAATDCSTLPMCGLVDGGNF
jgi:hypothetical protein